MSCACDPTHKKNIKIKKCIESRDMFNRVYLSTYDIKYIISACVYYTKIVKKKKSGFAH